MARLHLIGKELRNKDERKGGGFLNPALRDFTASGYIVTFPGQVKAKKKSKLKRGKINVFANYFELRKIKTNT